MYSFFFHFLIHFLSFFFFFFNDTATTEIYTLSLHDALPISCARTGNSEVVLGGIPRLGPAPRVVYRGSKAHILPRSEEHTSELQSRLHLVCRLLLEKKKKKHTPQMLPRSSRRIESPE